MSRPPRQSPRTSGSANRSTTTRDRHRAVIARDAPPCHICGQPIDYGLRHPDPMSYVVDHVTPLARGGLDVIENKAAAHRTCNRAKSDMGLDEFARKRFGSPSPAPKAVEASPIW